MSSDRRLPIWLKVSTDKFHRFSKYFKYYQCIGYLLKLYLNFAEEFAAYKHLYGGVFFVKRLPKTDTGKFHKVGLKKEVLAGTYELF